MITKTTHLARSIGFHHNIDSDQLLQMRSLVTHLCSDGSKVTKPVRGLPPLTNNQMIMMTTFTILSDTHTEAIRGGDGSWGSTSYSTIFSAAGYKNALKQSLFATNVVVGGGRNSFTGVINGQENLGLQSITQQS